MNLIPVAPNMNELVFERNGNLYKVLFSYRTPVAAVLNGDHFYQTEKKWSNTTSRHVKKWLALYGDPGAQYKPQEFFEGIVSEVK
jgi:hypothetical protein